MSEPQMIFGTAGPVVHHDADPKPSVEEAIANLNLTLAEIHAFETTAKGTPVALESGVSQAPPRLPTVAAARKAIPLYSGCFRYFPDALAAVAELSRIGNDQHNPGQPLFWDRSKSGDELDALSRHLFEAGTLDTDGVRHSAKVAWRALANLQKEIERGTSA